VQNCCERGIGNEIFGAYGPARKENARYSFQQLTSTVEKRKPTTPREQGSKLPQEQIMVPVRKVDEINKYLKKGYETKIELSNKRVVLYIPERASH
jgi:hypothetical protein